MQPEPEVTIGIPAYNASAFLERTISSALDQTWSPTRVVVSVDHSDDNTAELALALASKWEAGWQTPTPFCVLLNRLT